MDGPAGEATRVVAGRYHLLAKIGQGGMGTVWRARDALLGRTVAIKEVHLAQIAAAERAQMRERTLREAQAAARLSHPNAVTVFDVVEDQGAPWIVMSLVVGDSLADLIRDRGPLPPRRTAEIGLALLGALEAAHRVGILHRDVKPSNVLLGQDGGVVLTDFGIATVEGDASLTSTGLLFGSPAYMAPERARGERPGPASDLWSLGATLYAAVEGCAPYERSTPVATLTALAVDDLPPPRRAGALTPALGALLERDPRRRVDAASARRLLEQVVTGRPDPAPRAVATTTMQPRPMPAVATDHPVRPPQPEFRTVITSSGPASYRPPRRRSGASVALLVMLGLALAGILTGAAVYAGTRDNRGVTPNGQGSSASTASGRPGSPKPPATATGSSDGLVKISPGAAQQVPADVGNAAVSVLHDYFAGINNRNPKAAYQTFSPARQADFPYAKWSAAVAQSTDDNIVITQVTGAVATLASGPIKATVSFTSHQPGNLGPSPGETCTAWNLMYMLVPKPAASGYLIDGAKAASGSGHTAC